MHIGWCYWLKGLLCICRFILELCPTIVLWLIGHLLLWDVKTPHTTIYTLFLRKGSKLLSLISHLLLLSFGSYIRMNHHAECHSPIAFSNLCSTSATYISVFSAALMAVRTCAFCSKCSALQCHFWRFQQSETLRIRSGVFSLNGNSHICTLKWGTRFYAKSAIRMCLCRRSATSNATSCLLVMTSMVH